MSRVDGNDEVLNKKHSPICSIVVVRFKRRLVNMSFFPTWGETVSGIYHYNLWRENVICVTHNGRLQNHPLTSDIITVKMSLTRVIVVLSNAFPVLILPTPSRNPQFPNTNRAFFHCNEVGEKKESARGFPRLQIIIIRKYPGMEKTRTAFHASSTTIGISLASG